MDNGRVQNVENLSAKELTEQINQATDSWQGLEDERASLADSAERVAEKITSSEAVQEIARDQEELVDPVEFVGDETKLQVEERLAAERENSLNAIDPNRDSGAERVKRDQGRLARAAMAEAEKMVHQKQFSPADLEKMHYKMTNEALLDEENPYYVGKGN